MLPDVPLGHVRVVGGQVLGQTQLSEQGCLQRGHLLHTQEDVLLTPFGLQDPDSKYISN